MKLSGKEQEVSELQGKQKPLFILQNSSGIGYGVFRTGKEVISDFSLVKDPVSRASAYISLYENMLGIRYYVAGIIAFFTGQLQKKIQSLT